MKKIPFDALLREGIEAGKYIVVVEYDTKMFPARIVCWDFNKNNLLVCVNYGDEEDVLVYDREGRHIGKSVGRPSLLLIEATKPELTEFEEELAHLLCLYNDCASELTDTQLATFKEDAASLFSVARKELEPEFEKLLEQAYKNQDAVVFKKGKEEGRKEALENMPKWKKWSNGACGNGKQEPIAIIRYPGGSFSLTSCLGVHGEEYIMLEDLNKLPKE